MNVKAYFYEGKKNVLKKNNNWQSFNTTNIQTLVHLKAFALVVPLFRAWYPEYASLDPSRDRKSVV